MNQEVIQSLITPNAYTINKVFSEKDRYYIDIYQRDYKWGKDQIETLLSDIELNFNLSKPEVQDPKKIKPDVLERFKPYFLNTYLTSRTANHVSIVDGQQRLTTFLIILIYLRHLVKTIHETKDYEIKTVSIKTLEKLIFEADDFDDPVYYKIYNPNRQGAFDFIMGRLDSFVPEDETQKRIVENYNLIRKRLNSFFIKEDELVDVTKVTYYIYYILDKLNLVEVRIEQQENVATIFEVVNDRGLGLKPYEILKGKLLGNLKPKEKEEANKVWVKMQNLYYNTEVKNSTENDVDLDTFFKTYLRAKFANSENDYKKLEGKYHYEIYRDPKILNSFGRFDDAEVLHSWVVNEFNYFAKLHLTIRSSYNNPYLVFNKLLDQNQQYLLIMSAVKLDDEQEQLKIKTTAKKFDQLHVTLRLLDLYDSNVMQNLVYKLMVKVRNKDVEEIENAFNDVLITYLEEEGVISQGVYHSIGDLYKFDLFKNIRNRWLNFSKYILMRIDRTLSETLDKPSYCSQSLEELEERFNKNNRRRYGMHLEHIIANNDVNKELFTNEDGIFDESLYNRTRNLLGAVLLLKDKQNISSNNDYYSDKIDDYATSNLIWNELLVGHVDPIDTRNLPHYVTKVDAGDQGEFPLNMIDQRQKELFDYIKHIWGF